MYARRPYIVCVMWWPLIGGFIAFILIAVILGWWVDPDRRRDAR
jgi:cell division protein FtsX